MTTTTTTLAAENVLRLNLGWLDYVLVAIYFVFVLGIGLLARSQISTSLDFFLSGRRLARLGHRLGVRVRQSRRRRDHGNVGQRRPDRVVDDALLLDRRRARDAVPRHRDDALLLRLEGAQRSGVHAQAVRPRRSFGQCDQLRGRAGVDRRREPVPARHRDQRPPWLEPLAVADRGRGHRADLYRFGWSLGGDLQRGVAVLRDPRRARAPDHLRDDQGRRLSGL